MDSNILRDQYLESASNKHNRDLSILRQQVKDNITKNIDEKLPHEYYQRCLTGFTAILKEAWTTSQQAGDKREKIQSLSLAKEHDSF